MERFCCFKIKNVIGKGAEGVIYDGEFLGKKVIIKKRIEKAFRIKEIDEKIRRIRTLVEARMLHRAKKAGVPCPYVFLIDEDMLVLSFIPGHRANPSQDLAKWMAGMLVRLHNFHIIHNDFTPANVIEQDGKRYVIDFGLSFYSEKLEDKAMDLLVLKKAFPKHLQSMILDEYRKNGGKDEVVGRVREIELRGRYQSKN
jgi:Kae1-associated kinase Bud32